MSSYIPEYVYGFTGRDDQNQATYGFVPWPEHLKPREKPAAPPAKELAQIALAEAGGVFFVTLDSRDRASIATTIERLIDMLDTLEPDADLEPSLGAPETIPSASWANGGLDRYGRDGSGDQTRWAMDNSDEREQDAGDDRELEDEHGGDVLDEPHDWDEREPELGWCESSGQGLRIGIDMSRNDFDYDYDA